MADNQFNELVMEVGTLRIPKEYDVLVNVIPEYLTVVSDFSHIVYSEKATIKVYREARTRKHVLIHQTNET